LIASVIGWRRRLKKDEDIVFILLNSSWINKNKLIDQSNINFIFREDYERRNYSSKSKSEKVLKELVLLFSISRSLLQNLFSP